MKLTNIDVFGRPFEPEWCSDDRRQFSSREVCLVLQSFKCVRQEDDDALRYAAPMCLMWRWLQAADMPTKFQNKAIKTIRVYRSRVDAEADSAQWSTEIEAQMEAWGKILVEAGVWGKRDGRIPPSAYESTPGGVLVVKAMLEDGWILYLRKETENWQEVPISARHHFFAIDQAAKVEQLTAKTEPTSKESSVSSCLDDIAALTSEQRQELAKMLVLLKFDDSEAAAAAAYATGITAERAAKRCRLSKRQFQRKLASIPEPYKKLFSGTAKQRRERTRLDTVAKQSELIDSLRQLVAIRAQEAAEERQLSDNDPLASQVHI